MVRIPLLLTTLPLAHGFVPSAHLGASSSGTVVRRTGSALQLADATPLMDTATAASMLEMAAGDAASVSSVSSSSPFTLLLLLLLSSSDMDDGSIIASSTTAAITSTTTPAATTFEPILPDTSVLVGMASIVVLSGVAVWAWANLVVPVSRTNLALSKRSGPVRDYLDELRASDPRFVEEETLVETTDPATPRTTAATTEETTTTMVTAAENGESMATTTTVAVAPPPSSSESSSSSVTEPSTQDSRALERWLFTDWLENNKSAAAGSKSVGSKPGRQKEPALPILKKAKWNSGDNPVLAASALIMLGVLFSAVTERVASWL